MRGSLEATKMTGLAAVPVTYSPVTSRVVKAGAGDPSSLWFGIDWIDEMSCSAVTAYWLTPLRATV